MSAPRPFAELFGQLRAEFVQGASVRLEAMAAALRALAENPGDAARLQELRRAFHSFAGSGKTYGFPRVSRLALEGDSQCVVRLREGAPSAQEVAGWQALLAALRDELSGGVEAGVGARAPRAAAGAPLRDARILSLEDDPHHAAFVRAVLTAAGGEVLVAPDPRGFDAEVATFDPHVILMDVMLPGASGYDVVRALRADARHRHRAVLFLTAERRPEVRLLASQAGGTGCLRKPVTAGRLVSAVAAHVRR